jgi:hypothetical protein
LWRGNTDLKRVLMNLMHAKLFGARSDRYSCLYRQTVQKWTTAAVAGPYVTERFTLSPTDHGRGRSAT